MSKALGYAARDKTAPLTPFHFERRATRPNDVGIDILYCGVCHTDLHTVRDEVYGTAYPCVPGHEIVGRVAEVGSQVREFAVGDIVGVGCMVDSCQACSACEKGLEQYCETMFTGTYNMPDRETGANTYGGYSDFIVVREEFVLRIRHDEKSLAAVAPLLCAGITTWSPLRAAGVGPQSTVGVVGIGGLGHMGIKLARALGAKVIAFTGSASKKEAALALGAHDVVLTSNPGEMASYLGMLDLVIDTVSASHNLDPYVSLLNCGGSLVLLGAPHEPHPSPSVPLLLLKRRSIGGSLIGGIDETQELLDFCAEHDIASDVEMISMSEIGTAFERMIKSDVRYRFVIDMESLKLIA